MQIIEGIRDVQSIYSFRQHVEKHQDACRKCWYSSCARHKSLWHGACLYSQINLKIYGCYSLQSQLLLPFFSLFLWKKISFSSILRVVNLYFLPFAMVPFPSYIWKQRRVRRLDSKKTWGTCSFQAVHTYYFSTRISRRIRS